MWRYGDDGRSKIAYQIWNSTKPVGSGTSRYMTRVMQKKRRKSDQPSFIYGTAWKKDATTELVDGGDRRFQRD